MIPPATPVSVIMVLHDSAAVVERALDSLEQQGLPLQLVVADSGSRDAGLARVRAAWPSAVTLALDANRGFAVACNAALERVTGRSVLLLNPDAALEPGALQLLVAQLEATAPCVMAAPTLLGRDGRTRLADGDMPSIGSWLRDLLPRGTTHRTAPRQGASPAAWFEASCVLIECAALQREGGFDEAYFLYFEDVELGARLRAAGGSLVRVSAARALHSGAGGSGAYDASRIRAWHTSARLWVGRHLPGWRAPVARAGLTLRAALRAMAWPLAVATGVPMRERLRRSAAWGRAALSMFMGAR